MTPQKFGRGVILPGLVKAHQKIMTASNFFHLHFSVVLDPQGSLLNITISSFCRYPRNPWYEKDLVLKNTSADKKVLPTPRKYAQHLDNTRKYAAFFMQLLDGIRLYSESDAAINQDNRTSQQQPTSRRGTTNITNITPRQQPTTWQNMKQHSNTTTNKNNSAHPQQPHPPKHHQHH
jgi:hypothetical protein